MKLLEKKYNDHLTIYGGLVDSVDFKNDGNLAAVKLSGSDKSVFLQFWNDEKKTLADWIKATKLSKGKFLMALSSKSMDGKFDKGLDFKFTGEYKIPGEEGKRDSYLIASYVGNLDKQDRKDGSGKMYTCAVAVERFDKDNTSNVNVWKTLYLTEELYKALSVVTKEAKEATGKNPLIIFHCGDENSKSAANGNVYFSHKLFSFDKVD